MSSMLLQLLSVCAVSVIPPTSSQSTYGITEGADDVQSCGRTEQVLNQLVKVNSQLTTAVSQLHVENSQLINAVSQLQRDVAELKSSDRRKDVTGTHSLIILLLLILVWETVICVFHMLNCLPTNGIIG